MRLLIISNDSLHCFCDVLHLIAGSLLIYNESWTVLLLSKEIGHVSEYRIIQRKTPESPEYRNVYNQKYLPWQVLQGFKQCVNKHKINMMCPNLLSTTLNYNLEYIGKKENDDWFAEQEASRRQHLYHLLTCYSSQLTIVKNNSSPILLGWAFIFWYCLKNDQLSICRPALCR